MYKWDAAVMPLEVELSDDFSPTEQDAIQETLGEWQKTQSDIQFFSLPATTTPNLNLPNYYQYRDEDKIIGIYKSYDWFNSISPNTLAITVLRAYLINEGPSEYYEIDLVDIIVNYRDHSYSLDNSPLTFDLPSIVLHELGHLLGLDHQWDSSIDAIMNPTISRNQLRRTLHENDIARIRHNYSNSIHAISNSVEFASGSNSKRPEVIYGYFEIKADGECTRRLFEEKNRYAMPVELFEKYLKVK